MPEKIVRLDIYIYRDIKDIQPGDSFLLDLSVEGFSEPRVEERLKELAKEGYITVKETFGATTVSGVTVNGHDFFRTRLQPDGT